MNGKDLGIRIKIAREGKKITLKAMGELLGIGLTTYSSKESRGDFDDSELVKIFKKIGSSRQRVEAIDVPQQENIETSLAEALISIEAKEDVILSALAELLAKQNGQSVTGSLNELTKAVKERYDHRRNELLKSKGS